MKGCLAVVGVLALLLVVLFAGCTGYFVYKGHQYGQKHEDALARLVTTNSAHPFTPPEDGRLDASRFAVYLEARSGATGPVEAMFARTGELEQMDEETGFFEAMSTAFGAVKGIAQAVLEAPQALADSLAAQQMSFAEYDWINGVVHATIERAAEDGEEAATALEEAITATFGTMNATVNEDEYDRDALKELRDRISDWTPENLALIAAHSDQIAAGVQVLLVDVFTTNLADEMSGAPEDS